MDTPTLYKGLSKKITVIAPQHVAKSDVGKLEEKKIKERNVVWATSDKRFAKLFAVLPSTIYWRPEYRDGKPILILHDVDWETKLDLNQIGYVYKLPSEGFKQVGGIEYVSTKQVEPITIEEVNGKSVLKEYEIYAVKKITLPH